jgi:hypothetical protein
MHPRRTLWKLPAPSDRSIAFLTNTDLRPKMQDLIPQVDKMDLSDDKSFERAFVKYLPF